MVLGTFYHLLELLMTLWAKSYLAVKFSEYFGKLYARLSLIHIGIVSCIKSSSYIKFHSYENIPLKQFAFSFRGECVFLK